MLAVFLTLLGLLIFTKPVFGGEPPIQISPSNGSSVTSPTLNWQAPAYPLYSQGSPYRVQVDNDSAFASVDKNYYKTTTSYSPQDLSEGMWYWRVMAKDSSGAWSDWSSIWSFILIIPTPSPAPSPTQTSAPLPSSSSNLPTSNFTISNVPSQINSDQSFNVSVNLTLPENSNTNFYLKGAFKKADGSNYFGQTLVSGSWVKNGSSYSNQFPITTDNSGNWSGNLDIKPDDDDSGFTDSGDYIFKIGRYSQAGSGPTWSNEETVRIIMTTSALSETDGNTSSPKSSPSPSVTPSFIYTKTKGSNKLTLSIASVAAASASASVTASPEVEIKNQKQINPFILIGLIFIIAGGASIGYIYLHKNAKIPF